MKPELVTIDNDEAADPPPLQEVEFALILAQMINTVKQDPTQLRFAVYEFARSKLTNNLPGTDEAERKRLQSALEVAIKGVEQFSQRTDQDQRLLPPPPSTALTVRADVPARSQVTVISSNSSGYTEAEWKPLPARFGERRRTFRIWHAASIAAGLLIAAGLAGAVYAPRALQVPAPSATAPVATPEAKAIAPSEALPFALPGDYGIYALNDGKLSELHPLPIMVPDKRVALSTPVSMESRTTLPDGHAKFVVFRRDIATDAPDRVDVRVVAKVLRALTFDAKGKANYSPVSNEWNIRNTTFEFRVRPIAGHPEMLLIQPENPDFALAPGRYVLALKSQAYDFTIAGEVTDPLQCLERTDAANGTFYSDCQKQEP
ncbi:MAG TPA: hypothetical protein VG168_07865 [Bryobacteraceae bacterium]|nr:hypothetical protein [Bryobacteraceae bacterium]